MKKALEVMCSLGRFSYELAKESVEEVSFFFFFFVCVCVFFFFFVMA